MTGAPLVPVSWGELIDKITILEIKLVRLTDPVARANASREHALLRAALVAGGRSGGLAEFQAGLMAVNARLWRLEDAIRRCEAAGDFGSAFVALARAVYRENDERWRIKRAINRLLDSPLVEEKQYTAYG